MKNILMHLVFLPISCAVFRFKQVALCSVAGLSIWWLGNKDVHVGVLTFPKLSCFYTFILIAVLFASTNQQFLYLLINTADRDREALSRFIQVKLAVYRASKDNMTIPKLFCRNVAKNPNKTALIFEGEEWSFSKIDEYSNRVANFLDSKGFKRGDSISLFMENRPEFIATWIGCAKIGIKTALINFNLRQATLIHSIKIVDSKAVICGAELQNAINDVIKEISDLPIYVSGLTEEKILSSAWLNMDIALCSSSPTPPRQMDDGNFHDDLLYIYTSGTTGMPKAAIIKNSRFLYFCTGLHYMIQIDENEVIYNPLPLYHTAGGMVGMGQVLVYNCSAVIRRKFSASNYWIEANKYGCTIAQYVGEICRYLLNCPPRPEDKQHKVRVMFGNGVRAQIWEQFTQRFNMPWICEFYGATESNANIINMEGKPGACGFLSVVAPWVYPVSLIRVDVDTGQPIRDEDGLCIRCGPGEAGEFVGKIRKDNPMNDFHGYADKDATQKKIVRDVFQKGDLGFLSGDILVMDTFGYVYFQDRLGDTFRWRGENVSTTEVEGIVSQVSNNKDAVVYGVEVPGTEGRAGMAAIVDPAQNLDITDFGKSMEKYLPAYARPLFLRILNEIDVTGTFKLKKLDLQKQGFCIDKIRDKMYFLDYKKKEYVPLDKELYDKIIDAKVGL